MDAQTFYAIANYSSLQNSIITEYLTDYENTIADKAAALKEFGNLQRNPQAGQKPIIKHPKTGKRYQVRLEQGCASLADISSDLLRFSWRRLKDGRTFVLISRWPL